MYFKSHFEPHFNDFVWVKTKDKTPIPNRKSWNLKVPIQADYKAKNKLLIIVGHVSGLDIHDKALLGNDISRKTYFNVLNYAFEHALNYRPKLKAKDWSLHFYNYNYFKWYDLDKSAKLRAEASALERLKQHIKDVKPTHIVCMNDQVAEALLEDDMASRKRGWLRKYGKAKFVNTIDIERSFAGRSDADDDAADAQIEHANLLGYVSRTISTIFLKETPHHIQVKPKAVLLTKIKDVKALVKRMNKARYIACDTEGTSLETLENQLATIQFALDETEGYIIPYYHQDSPWTPTEFKELKKILSEFFGQKHEPYNGTKTRFLIGQNFGYDIRVLMKEFNLRYWYWNTWDMMAGEYMLDENIKGLVAYGQGQYGLEQMSLNYGSTFYVDATFGKAQRTLIASSSLTKEVLEYTTMDVQLMVAIHKEQLKKAKLIRKKDGSSYLPDYWRLMLTQLSTMVRVMSLMKYRGIKTDIDYLMGLLNPNSSEILVQLDKLNQEFYSLPEVKKASTIINNTKGAPSTGLFGNSFTAFDIGKKDHQYTLFIDIMKLEPLSYGKSGEPSFGKEFYKAYKDHRVIQIVQEMAKLNKLKSAFIDSYIKQVEGSHDGKLDQRIRADFGYIGVVTGRSNSRNPNFQQIPEHSAESKLIKRMFVTPPGTLHFEADYSAHEVRVWSITADDDNLRQSFHNIHKLIIKFRRDPTPENLHIKETQADPHKQNYHSFTEVPLEDINKDMRQDAKGIVFGAMYGKGLAALARDTGKTIEEIEKIYNAFFKKFKKGKLWLVDQVNTANTYMYGVGLMGRRRNLYGVMSGNRAMAAACKRQAQNSPIQGCASDIGFIAADLYSRTMHELFEKLGVKHKSHKIGKSTSKVSYLPTAPNAMVHDSIKAELPFEYFFMGMHILEWAMTNGVTKYLRDVHGVITGVPFDIEFDIGSSWKDKETWDFSEANLVERTLNAIKGHKEIYKGNPEIDKIKPKKLLRKMREAYFTQCKDLELHQKYPLNII